MGTEQESDIVFFGAVDKNPATGAVKSEYPSWWHDRQIEELQDTVHSQEQFIKNGRVGADHVQQAIADLETHKEKLHLIESSMPKMSDRQRDTVAKGFKDMKGLIQETLHTYDQVERRTIDAHDEATRMSTPCISLKKNPDLAKLANSCNVPISRDGKISRDHATKMAHIMSKSLGERFFVESLRK